MSIPACELPMLTFNRTSLELKSAWNSQSNPQAHFLLIAPVWYWKFAYNSHGYHQGNLLIAPVWNWKLSKKGWKTASGGVAFNRTSLELKTVTWKRIGQTTTLLIAPVWNWKETLALAKKLFSTTFNRTSLELKTNRRCGPVPSSFHLLIAPVWNWKKGEVCVSAEVDATFNRTSLELKNWYWFRHWCAYAFF